MKHNQHTYFFYRRTIFLRSCDTFVEFFGAPIMANNIHGHIRQAIMDVGLANVVQIVVDNASNCKLMGSMIAKEFSTHCVESMCYTLP